VHIGKEYCLDHYKEFGEYVYGIDAEIKKKLQAKLDPVRMREAQAWIEAVTGSQFPADFQESLKSGVLLCKLVNAIKPGAVAKINAETSPFKQRENIDRYLAACSQLGMKETDKFMVIDLYEAQNLVAVVDNIFVLGGIAQKVPGFAGPHLGVKIADKQERSFAPEVLAAGRSLPSRQTVGSYGYQDESKNPTLARQIIRNVAGGEASSEPTKVSQGSYGVMQPSTGAAIDKIVRNPEEFSRNRGAGAASPRQEGQGSAAAGGASAGAAKFCAKCGAERVGAAKFCGQCGEKF
jgi:hypothetical protein